MIERSVNCGARIDVINQIYRGIERLKTLDHIFERKIQVFHLFSRYLTHFKDEKMMMKKWIIVPQGCISVVLRTCFTSLAIYKVIKPFRK